MNSLPLDISMLPQEQYLAYPARLSSILPWMWMAFLSEFVFSESIELSPPLTSSTILLFPSQ
jgi:hypothetical protein